MNNYLKLGDWNALCDVCGFKHKASKLRRRWDGLMVCSQDFETRHPQTLLQVPRENSSVPWSRPEAADVFITIPLGLQTTVTELPIFTELGISLQTET